MYEWKSNHIFILNRYSINVSNINIFIQRNKRDTKYIQKYKYNMYDIDVEIL